MAPFMRTFRRHRKVMLAVLTLLAMLSFVFVPTIMQLMETHGGRGNSVVVTTTKYGSIREAQLQMMLRQRQRLYMFFRQLAGTVQVKGGRGDAIREALGMFGAPADEEAAIDDWLMARKAEQSGLKVSQKAVNDYLASLTEGKAGTDDVRQILSGQHVSQPQLFEALRQQMLSIRFYQMFWVSLAATTPSQRWEYYQQLNRRARIEAVPVAVSKFADKIAAPSEDVLKTFFEKYKERPHDPDSPEPGFRVPHRIDVEYFKAPYEAFIDPAGVSEQAIRDYYEANKEQLYKDMLPPEAPPPAAPKVEPTKPEPPKTEPAKSPGSAKGEAPKTEPAKPEAKKTSAPAAEPVKPSPAKTETPKPAAPKSEPPKSETPKSKAAAPSPGKGASMPRRSPFHLVSDQKTTLPAQAVKTAPPAPKTEPSATKTEKPSAKVEPAAPKVEPIAPKTQPAAPKAAPPAAAPVKYKPFADVKEEIRKALARQAAKEKVRDVLRRVQDKLAQYETQWTLYDTLEPEKKASTPPPLRPNFVELAKENRLTAAQTGLMSAIQMAGTDIGRSRVEGRTAFVQAAFEKNVPVFLPGLSEDNEGTSYLFWKLIESPERVPEFDEPEVRKQVLETWKLIEARDLAVKEAERLAAEARNAKKPLAEVFSGRKDLSVVSPPPFTWLTFGNVPVWFRMRPPQYSEVEGISNAGTEFMQAVFGLKTGEIGAATDQPKTTVYVVRLVEYTPSDPVLWDLFLADDYRGYAMAARYDQAVANRLWREGLKKEAGLHWERDPVRARVEAED